MSSIIVNNKKLKIVQDFYFDTKAPAVYLFNDNNFAVPHLYLTSNFFGSERILNNGEIAVIATEENEIYRNKLLSSGVLEDTGHRIHLGNIILQKWMMLKDIIFIKDLL